MVHWKKSDYIIIDTIFGCVREMLDKNNKNFILVTGLDNVPYVGIFFMFLKIKKMHKKKLIEIKKKLSILVVAIMIFWLIIVKFWFINLCWFIGSVEAIKNVLTK